MSLTIYLLSPDLRPIKKVYAHLVPKLCENGRQYFSTEDLSTAIEHTWPERSSEVMQNLVF